MIDTCNASSMRGKPVLLDTRCWMSAITAQVKTDFPHYISPAHRFQADLFILVHFQVRAHLTAFDKKQVVCSITLADDPCSGTFYDPDGDGAGLQSLGVHEHWNNAADKQYSRNLGSGNGIELIAVRSGKTGDFDTDGDIDIFDMTCFFSCWLQPNLICLFDLNADGNVNMRDFAIFTQKYAGSL